MDKEASDKSSIESIPDNDNEKGDGFQNDETKSLNNKSYKDTDDEISTKSNFDFSFTGYESGDELSNDNLNNSLNEISTEELITATDENFNENNNANPDELSNQSHNVASTKDLNNDDYKSNYNTNENNVAEGDYEIIEYNQTGK